jgi:acetyl-CoA C-acetyltransferase
MLICCTFPLPVQCSMSNVPHYAPGMRAGTRLGHSQLLDGMLHDGLWDATHDIHMGECAGRG